MLSMRSGNARLARIVWGILQAWETDGAGVVINERLLNCPPQLASPLHHGLFDEEIPWAVEDESTEELRQSFDFKHYLFVSRVYQDMFQDDGKQAAAQQGATKPRKRQKVSVLDELCMLLCLTSPWPGDISRAQHASCCKACSPESW